MRAKLQLFANIIWAHLLVISFFFVFAACSDSGETPGAEDGVYPPVPGRPFAATCAIDTLPPASGAIQLERVFSSELDGASARAITSLIESPFEPLRWYVSTLEGRVYTFVAGEGRAELVLDLSDVTYRDHHETGLTGVAFDPRESSPRELYVVYSGPATADEPFDNIVSRFSYEQASHRADRDSEEILFRLPDPHGSHNANQVVFDSSGLLYVPIGDSANPNDRYGHGQRLSSLYATILRVDPEPRGEAELYTVPEDNPFVGVSGARDEIYAYGLRNPWRMSIDEVSGRVFAGDVGQDTWEEANEIVAGGNYGWSITEGPNCFAAETCDTSGLEEPLWAYSRSEGASITVGPVYRGAEVPELQGRLIVGDYVNGNIWSVAVDTEGEVEARVEAESGLNIVHITSDSEGELFVVDIGSDGNSRIFRARPASDEPTDFPLLLSETGCMQPANPSEPLDGVVSYEPISPLWSDGSEKRRFLHIPEDRRLGISRDGDLLFPPGTILIKHFGFGEVLHETRLLVRYADRWRGYSYEWREDGSDAELVDVSRTRELPNGVRWVYPSRGQCMECHTEAAARALGPEFAQLAHPGADENIDSTQAEVQFTELVALGYLAPEAEERFDEIADTLVGLVDPADDSNTYEQRARSYLHSNCAQCHRPGSTSTQASIDLRYGVPLAEMGLCGERPEQGTLFLPNGEDLELLKPGVPEESIVWLRMETLDLFRMPPLATGVPDAVGLEVVEEWIRSIEACP